MSRKSFKLDEKKKPEVIFLAAAKVGGIAANITFPRDFLYDNIMISFNIINSAKLIKVANQNSVFPGSAAVAAGHLVCTTFRDLALLILTRVKKSLLGNSYSFERI